MKRLIDKSFITIEYAIGVIGLIGILLISAGVFTRFVLKISMSWADEALRTMFMYAYFIGAAALLYDSDLMRLELIEDNLKQRNKRKLYIGLKIIAGIIVSAILSIVTYYAVQMDIQYIILGVPTSTSNTPAWILPAGYALGMALLTVIYITRTGKLIKGKSGGDLEA